jgi:hypothetical protein
VLSIVVQCSMSNKTGRVVGFKTTDRDEAVLQVIGRSKYGGLSTAAVLRMALAGWAESEGLYDPTEHSNQLTKAEALIALHREG